MEKNWKSIFVAVEISNSPYVICAYKIGYRIKHCALRENRNAWKQIEILSVPNHFRCEIGFPENQTFFDGIESFFAVVVPHGWSYQDKMQLKFSQISDCENLLWSA